MQSDSTSKKEKILPMDADFNKQAVLDNRESITRLLAAFFDPADTSGSIDWHRVSAYLFDLGIDFPDEHRTRGDSMEAAKEPATDRLLAIRCNTVP